MVRKAPASSDFAQRPLFHPAHLHLRSGAICRFAKQIANRVFLAGLGRHRQQLSNP